jgi:solute carrier family 35 protein E3
MATKKSEEQEELLADAAKSPVADKNDAPTKEDAPDSASVVAFWVIGSVACSVGLIITNKVIMKTYNFPFVFTLTTCHFLAQALLLETFSLTGVFEAKKMPFNDNAKLGAAMVASVAFMNFSLKHNSVGFYQICKLACVPFMVLVQSFFYNQVFSRRIMATLALITLGVGAAVVTDVELNLMGSVFGLAAIMSTTFWQIWQGTYQGKYELKGYQFPHSISPAILVIVASCALIFEVLPIVPDQPTVLDHPFDLMQLSVIGASSFMAIGVNVFTAGLIRVTSPVTYQVVGHAKTIGVLTGGFIMFPLPDGTTSSEMLKNMFGMALAMSGVILYGHLKTAKEKDCCVQNHGQGLMSHIRHSFKFTNKF